MGQNHTSKRKRPKYTQKELWKAQDSPALQSSGFLRAHPFNCSRHISEMQHDTGDFMTPPTHTHPLTGNPTLLCAAEPLAHVPEAARASETPKDGPAKTQPTHFPKNGASPY